MYRILYASTEGRVKHHGHIMAHSIKKVAHRSQNGNGSRLFVLTLGRSRSGFDQEWSASIVRRCNAYLSERYRVHIEPETVRSAARLTSLLESPKARQADVLLFLQPSIADGALVNPIAQCASNKSILFWATPERSEGNIVSSNSLVGTHLFVATLAQYGLTPGFVYGDVGDATVQEELHREVMVLSAVSTTRRARVGLIGAHAPGFIDLHVDPRHLSACTGATMEHLTMHQFFDHMKEVTAEQIQACSERLRARALPSRDIAPKDAESMLRMQAHYWTAYLHIVDAYGWDALALRCWPDLPQKYGHWPYVAVSMMLHDGYAVAIEGDVDAALSTMAARYLAPGAVYLSDWLSHTHNTVTLWHGGAVDPTLCVSDDDSEYRAHIAPHFNTKTPAVIEGDIKYDTEVTIWRVWQSRGKYYSTALEGETAAPSQHFRGTTALVQCKTDNLNEWFRDKLRHAMPHHVLMVHGKRHRELKLYADHMGWEWVE